MRIKVKLYIIKAIKFFKYKKTNKTIKINPNFIDK